ncbi:MAG TPA: methionine--tRNA ligase [Chthoniobacteraceae bacterium]|nr:methionine--tRNA ligase [Chthoniobacteraceae bacterium]
MAKTFFITTAIDYTNAAPHIGHAYEKILADVVARYHRLKGEPVYFLTGVDQHGQKVQQTAQKEGKEPAVFAAEVTEKFTALWKKLGLSYDRWAATTDPLHQQVVQAILSRLHEAGAIYKANHAGFYSVRQEQFLTDKDRGPDGAFGPEWGEVTEISEENYYFRLAEHRDWLLSYIDRHPAYVTPGFRQVELRNAVERLSGDLCISRPKSRLAWGIELPFDTDYVTYVWFDALINYVSFSGYGDANPREGVFGQRWPALHVIGKDILVPAHGVYWPIMLHALGFGDEEIPPLLVHGYINLSGAKMSKSTGNIVDPDALVDRYGPGALRYYLMREAVTGQDMDFSEDRLVQRYNTDLANDLGNLLNRTLNMVHRYRDGVLRKPADELPLAATIRQSVQKYVERFDQYQVHAALEAAGELARACNGTIESEAPWKLAKEKTPEAAARLEAVLYHLAEALRALSVLIAPVLPDAAAAMAAQLNLPQAPPALADLLNPGGGLPDGHRLNQPTPLFPRIESDAPTA